MATRLTKDLKKEEMKKKVRKIAGKSKLIDAKKFAGTVKSFTKLNALKYQKDGRNE
ncbi:MAG: hypothetical protein Q8941_18370 [Bacteroidota bacterium]|nr:hypothetical protein [Bacteroidota bacterium]